MPAQTVNCPRCATPVAWSPANPFRPFCSERCRLFDTAAWANEEYRIPGAPTSPGERQDDLSDSRPDRTNRQGSTR